MERAVPFCAAERRATAGLWRGVRSAIDFAAGISELVRLY
jgi:hypothetical protein